MQKRSIKYFLTGVFKLGILIFPLTGCVVAAVGAGGFAYLDKPHHPDVTLVRYLKNIDDCKETGRVESSTSWGGLALKAKAGEYVLSVLTHKAAKPGANKVLLTQHDVGFMGSTAEGIAYKCETNR